LTLTRNALSVGNHQPNFPDQSDRLTKERRRSTHSDIVYPGYTRTVYTLVKGSATTTGFQVALRRNTLPLHLAAEEDGAGGCPSRADLAGGQVPTTRVGGRAGRGGGDATAVTSLEPVVAGVVAARGGTGGGTERVGVGRVVAGGRGIGDLGTRSEVRVKISSRTTLSDHTLCDTTGHSPAE
jgi:hypothetical protein